MPVAICAHESVPIWGLPTANERNQMTTIASHEKHALNEKRLRTFDRRSNHDRRHRFSDVGQAVLVADDVMIYDPRLKVQKAAALIRALADKTEVSHLERTIQQRTTEAEREELLKLIEKVFRPPHQ